MNILEIARAHAKLIELTAFKWEDCEIGICALHFIFQDYGKCVLTVDPNYDSLSWRETNPPECNAVPFETPLPQFKDLYGLQLIWAWEMRNQQGYFDAFQLQFADNSLQNGKTLQFQGMGSAIQVFEVSRLRSS